MKHPKAQIKAIMRMRLFIQLTHIQHLAPQSVGAQAQSGIRQDRGWVCLLIHVSVCSMAVEEIIFRNVGSA